MDFRALRIFTTAAELGSLSRVSATLGIAQSALSRHISALETELKGRLFHRTGRGVELTEMGRSVLPRAQALLVDAQHLLQEAQGVMSNPRGTVALGLVPSLSRPIVGQLVTQLRRDFPGIRLRVHEGYSGEIDEWLANGRVDIGVTNRYRPSRRGNVVMSTQMMLVMRSDDPLLKARSIRFKALGALPLALPVRPNSMRIVLDELCQRAHVQFNVELEADSSVAIKDAILNGGLYSILPPHAFSAEKRLGLMQGLQIVEPVIRQATLVETTSFRPLTAAARTVWRLLPPLLCELASPAGSETARP